MIDSNKFKYKLGDIVSATISNTNVTGTIVGYYFLKGFNNYAYIYGYSIALNSKDTNAHSGEMWGYHANGKHIHPTYANSIIYALEYNIKLIKSRKDFIYKILQV